MGKLILISGLLTAGLGVGLYFIGGLAMILGAITVPAFLFVGAIFVVSSTHKVAGKAAGVIIDEIQEAMTQVA